MRGPTNVKFMTASRSVLVRMRDVSDKSCTENQNTHFVFNMVQSERPQMTTKCWAEKVELAPRITTRIQTLTQNM